MAYLGGVPLDDIGPWSEIKLTILERYGWHYADILARQQNPPFHFSYIDAFAGAGAHFSEATQGIVPGSPLNALNIEPRFNAYHFIDLDDAKVTLLKSLTESVAEEMNIHVHGGDCNEILLEQLLPPIRWKAFRRGVLILDPYGLHLDWKVMAMAGKLETIDLFLNFPIMDINMNVLKHDRARVKPEQAARMTRFWGDESWREVAYEEPPQRSLFGGEVLEKVSNEAVVEAFRKRLEDVAGFKHVPEPLAMRNKTNAVVYYLFFASQKDVAKKIASYLFKKYGEPATAPKRRRRG